MDPLARRGAPWIGFVFAAFDAEILFQPDKRRAFHQGLKFAHAWDRDARRRRSKGKIILTRSRRGIAPRIVSDARLADFRRRSSLGTRLAGLQPGRRGAL